MFYVYILKSIYFGTYYIGATSSLEDRLRRHNSGRVKSTANKKPWVILKYEQFDTRKEALDFEKYLKSLKNRERIEEIIKHF